MFKRLGLVLFVGVWTVFSSASASDDANCVEVDGTAQIQGGDVAYARQMAIRDAIAQAALTSQVRVTAQSETKNFSLTRQTAQFAAQQRVVSMKVLSEEQEGSRLIVHANVCLTDEAKTCPNYIARYQPKVVVANVAVQDMYSAKDIADVGPGYQTNLLSRMWSAGQRNTDMYDTTADLYPGIPIRPNLSPNLLLPIQDKTLAQFLVLTVIRSLDWEATQSKTVKDVRQYFGYDTEPNQRTVSVEWFVVDLNQQRIFAQGESFKKIEGEVRVGRDKPFGSRQFSVTPTGQAFDVVLSEQARSIMDQLACVPLESPIAEIDKDKVIVPIGIDSGVQMGDVLAVYSKSTRPYRYGSIDLGTSLEPTAFIRVQKVLPKFIVGVFEGKQGLVQAGDLVKSW